MEQLDMKEHGIKRRSNIPCKVVGGGGGVVIGHQSIFNGGFLILNMEMKPIQENYQGRKYRKYMGMPTSQACNLTYYLRSHVGSGLDQVALA